MTHPDNDTILRYALETIDGAEREDLKGHIGGCPDCSRVLEEISLDLAMISRSGPSTVIPPARLPAIPVLRSFTARAAFRAAAVITLILLGGYLLIGPGDGARVTVVPQRFTPPAVVVPAGEFAPCEAVDIAHLLPPPSHPR